MSRRAWVLAALPMLAVPALASAQPAGGLRDRTGPNSAPQALPPPAQPTPSLLPDTNAAAPAAPNPGAARVTLADVRVTAQPAGIAATPQPGWQAAVDPATGLTLDLKPGERFDAAWVHRQFVDNRLVGAPVPLDRLVALTQLINVAFVRNGYVNSGLLLSGGVPADGGTLEVRLVFGHTVSADPKAPAVAVAFGAHGSKGLSQRFVRDRMPAAAATPFDAIAVEREFRLLAQNDAIRTINADLRPGQTPGEAVLTVTVEPQDRFDLYASAANSRSPSIGGERYAVGGSMRNLAIAGDLISGEYGRTSGHDDFQLGYQAPLISPRLTASVQGGRNNAAVVDTLLRPLGIRSRDWSVEGGLAYKLIDTPLTPDSATGRIDPARALTLGVRLAHREQRTYLLGAPFSFSPGSVDGRSDYSALRVTADYLNRGVKQVLALSFTGTLGLDGTRPAGAGPLDPDQDFKAALVQVSYARRINANNLELRARLAGQYADGPLYSGERFSAGGENSVRGYRENLLLADTGAFGSVELAQPFRLGGGRAKGDMDWGAFTASAFVDGARVGNRKGADPIPRTIGSVGASLAWTPSDAISARITYAEALKDAPLVGKKDLQDRGVQFRVTVHPLAWFRRG